MPAVAIYVLQSIPGDKFSSIIVHGQASSFERVSGASLDVEHGDHRICLDDPTSVVIRAL